MTPGSLKSICTLADLVGPGHRIVYRASDRRSHWLPQDPMVRDALSAPVEAVNGRIPSLCSAGTVTPRVRGLLQSAGFEVHESFDTFVDASDYRRKLEEFTSPGRVVVQHVYPPDEIPAERYWIPPALLSFLNNKANLGELVPPEATPERRVLPREMFLQATPQANCVVKAATDDSTGGGRDVAVCRSQDDWAVARRLFGDTERVVVEELLTIHRSWCLNFGAWVDGRVDYFGSAEQLSLADGRFDGNWLEGIEPPAEAISFAREAMLRAAKMGYSGFAGIDIGLTNEGKVFVFDLNFRGNNSTFPVLLYGSIKREYGPVAMRVKRWFFEEKAWPALERMVESGRLIPFKIYDAAGGPYDGRPSFLSGAIVGKDRADIVDYEAESTILRGGLSPVERA